jgi:hypothetical protein
MDEFKKRWQVVERLRSIIQEIDDKPDWDERALAREIGALLKKWIRKEQDPKKKKVMQATLSTLDKLLSK